MSDRRTFLGSLVAAAAAVVLLPVRAVRAAKKQVAFRLDKAEKLKTVGGSAVLSIKGRDILFVRASDSEVRAFSPECSHQRCRVGYDASKGRIQCSCHGSAFAMDGKVLGGPATSPLPTYPATLADDRVVVTVEE
ncbi:MAG: Rieske (2Fe-2S) protein [Deltaproteobacteria bacterium]|nr:Rieske (2Fe-2S) protein [Deltaproteobacteria bacterium]